MKFGQHVHINGHPKLHTANLITYLLISLHLIRKNFPDNASLNLNYLKTHKESIRIVVKCFQWNNIILIHRMHYVLIKRSLGLN